MTSKPALRPVKMEYHADSPEKKPNNKSFIERLYAALISPLSDTEPHPIKVRLINGWHDFTSEKINIVVCNFLYDKTSRSHKMWKELETITGFRREHLFYALCAIFCYLLIQGNSLPVVYSLVVLVFPAVCTLLALNDQQLEGAIFWLKYWVVYAMITTLGKVVKRPPPESNDLSWMEIVFFAVCLIPSTYLVDIMISSISPILLLQEGPVKKNFEGRDAPEPDDEMYRIPGWPRPVRHLDRLTITRFKSYKVPLIKTLTIILILCIFCGARFAMIRYIRRLPLDESVPLLDSIDIDCDGLIEGDQTNISEYKKWQYTLIERVEATLVQSKNKCAAIKQMFQFNERPLSLEEQEYPLAYGIIVYMNAVQILFELAAFYHPQNEYCIAVSGSAEEYVQEFMLYVENCFPNIHVLTRPPINWGEFEIINTTFACLQQLQKSDKPWKYYQYLSGVDVPLRTNLEMVKIFKRLNDTVNAYVEPYPLDRLKTRKASHSPLPLIKSPLSVLLPRKTVEELVKASLTRELLDYLTPTFIADESFWGTMLGNPLEFNVSGSFNARQMIAFNELYQLEDPVGFKKYSTREVAMNGYISRYQVWTTEQCKGKIVHFSCVYGVEDLPVIVKQHYLVAHKFYIDYQPAAYFCMLKRIRKRTHTPEPFDASIYAEIPLVEFSRGIAFSNLTHPEWLLNLHGVVMNN
ncbi:hypothetical protein Q1695_013956 [Nippostrongylus brasiliensis]|nr:hypothetical protein Q1695_013956 [Nippostrongylus brasiliensis]